MQPNEFMERWEDKFFIPLENREKLLDCLHRKMALAPFYQSNSFNCISSIYFDSLKFDFFYDHYNNSSERMKMRIRKYGLNGFFDPKSEKYLEIKAKQAGLTKKTRFQVSELEISRLLSGSLIKKLRDFKYDVPLQAIGNIIYRRIAFENSECRLTIDWHLEYLPYLVQAINLSKVNYLNANTTVNNVLYDKYSLSKPCIVEVKHHGAIPDWLLVELKNCGAEKTSFSKYCYIIAKNYI